MYYWGFFAHILTFIVLSNERLVLDYLMNADNSDAFMTNIFLLQYY